MDGYETAKYIREEMPEKIANLPILAMTAHAHLARDNKFAGAAFKVAPFLF